MKTKTIILTFTLVVSFAASHEILSSDFIQSINAKQSTWIAGRNFHEDTPIEHLHRLNGAKRQHFNRSETHTSFVKTENIPESFDARDAWPECKSIGEIRDQGQCGSCWAFEAVEAMSDRFCIATKGKSFQFSPEELISCCSTCGDGCDGGWPIYAWEYWNDKGIVSGGDYNTQQGCQPYAEEAFRNGQTPKCEDKCTNANYANGFQQDKHFGEGYFRYYQDVEAIQTEILKSGPVEADFDVYDDFYSYKSGVYQHVAGDYAGGHAIKIIGWGVENGTPYWLIANSWGENWGDLGGFFKILRGENHCGIEDNITFGYPKL